MNYPRYDYTDALGFPRRVLVPPDAEPSEGIPVSLDFLTIYPHMPASFVLELTKACWNVGLIEPADFLKPGADKLFKSAMLSVIKHDWLNVVAIAQETYHGGN